MNEADDSQLSAILTAGIEEEAAAAALRMADRAEREGLADVAYAAYDSPLGIGYVAATERGIVSVALPNRSADQFLDQLAARISPRVLELRGRLGAALRELDQYFEGSRREFELPLDWRLVRSEFSSRVLHETAKLPYGVTSSYGEVAARAGNPRAYRAAGTALGRNPIPLVVPCHRVLQSGGGIGEYGGGPEMKEWLLRMEGAVG